ncbi:hypothetical protein HPB52_025389 [Rhipicephalus sanguineus]|uniref:Uncharacterized protein n=1 Tax=Rhipicephalus sanguineus TaxID=34632 RepID=A0A9D4TD64_RHISA|nr:hypothetical protein HPB52_025389 [Rhipicephalus sanguineus]
MAAASLPKSGGSIQDDCLGSTAGVQDCVRFQQVQQLAAKPHRRIPVLGYFRKNLQQHGKRAFVTFYVTAHGTSVLRLDAIQQLGRRIDGATLTCRLATPVSSQRPAGVPPWFEHLPGGALGRVKDYVHRAKRWQHIVPLSAKLRRLPLALRQQDASELRRLQDDVIVEGQGRRLHSTLYISNHVFPAQAIRGDPAVQCDLAPAEAQRQMSSELAHGSRNPSSSSGRYEYELSKSAPDRRHTQSLPAGPGSHRPQRTRKPPANSRTTLQTV